MIRNPSATDPTEESADWMELDALQSPNKQTSIASFAKLIRRNGSTDAFEGPLEDKGSVRSQQIAEDVFAEIENRSKACGSGNYPFQIERGSLHLKADASLFPYISLLLMSITKPTSGHNGSAALFEQMCTHATLGYLGGPGNGATAVRFGAPRKTPLAKLSQAIDDLCTSMAEGGGCLQPNRAKHTGDENLDIVAWRHFPDAKLGKLILFGQCAAGTAGWQKKLADMDARAFVKKWFRSTLAVDPVRVFFVPRRIPVADWSDAAIDGGILFDRCRIVACMVDMKKEQEDLRKKFTADSLKALSKK